jgi:hypothetical protein
MTPDRGARSADGHAKNRVEQYACVPCADQPLEHPINCGQILSAASRIVIVAALELLARCRRVLIAPGRVERSMS